MTMLAIQECYTGLGKIMNVEDAAQFCNMVGAQYVTYGMRGARTSHCAVTLMKDMPTRHAGLGPRISTGGQRN